MKTLTSSNGVTAKDIASTQVPIKVCMHVLERVRTDERVLREARTLLEQGFTVSIIDVEDDSTRPHAEDIQGISVKHIIMADWFDSSRFNVWFIFRAIQM